MPTDKKRLDHIEKNGSQKNMLPGCLQILWNGEGKTLRQAIDAAIKSERRGEG